MPKNPIGRPRKAKNNFFSIGICASTQFRLAQNIAAKLPNSGAEIINDLASVSKSFSLMRQLQVGTNLRGRGAGRRATIHIAMLYAECALVHEKHTGICASKTLASLGGWSEESQQDGKQDHEVLQYAKAVLEVDGVRFAGSHRQQIRNGLRYLGISPLFHAVNK